MRGLPVEDAERILQLCQKDAADDVLKLLGSAIANVEHNLSIEAEELFVARAWADEGPTRKWGQPRARGRYFRIRKRTSHVTIILDRFAVDELEERRRRDETTGRGAAVAQRRRAERGSAARARCKKTSPKQRTSKQRTSKQRKPKRHRPSKNLSKKCPRPKPNRKARTSNGAKSQPVRVPPRDHDRLEVALDRRQEGVPRTAHRGLEDPRLPAAPARARRGEPHRDRAHRRPSAHRRVHRAPGHRDRPAWCRGRASARRAAQDQRQPEDPVQHPRDQAARGRRDVARAGCRRPARRSCVVPARDEAGGADGDEGRRARAYVCSAAGAWAVRR